MNNTKSRIINLLLFIILTLTTYFIIFNNKDMKSIFDALKDVNIYYILLGVLSMFMYFLMESINVKSILKNFDKHISIFKALKYTFIGFFFSSITPSATGGQPAEIYYMSKEKIPASASALALLLEVSSYLLCTVSLSTIAFILNPNVIPGSLIYLFFLGTVVSLVVVSVYFICIFSKRLSRKLVKLAIKVLKFIKVKDIESVKLKLEEGLVKYHDGANYIRHHKIEVFFSFIRVLIQVLFFYSVSYFVYRSFGFETVSIFRFIAMQAVLYTTVSFIPLPGSVGISESIFLHIYSIAYPKELIGSSLLLTRGINFYLYVLIAALIVTFTSMKKK